MNQRVFADRSGTGAWAINVLVNRHWRKTGGELENATAELRQNYGSYGGSTAGRRKVAEEGWRPVSPNGPKWRLLQADDPSHPSPPGASHV